MNHKRKANSDRFITNIKNQYAGTSRGSNYEQDKLPNKFVKNQTVLIQNICKFPS